MRLLTYFLGAAAVASLVLPVGAGSASATGARDVAIFYYPWYSTPKRDGTWAHWYVREPDGTSLLSTHFYPARGLYSSSNPTVVAAQMKEIAATGIHTIVVSWWGNGSPEADRLPLVLDWARRYGLAVAVHIEPYPGRTPSSTAADITSLHAQGIMDFYVYDADSDPASAWADALGTLSDDIRVFAQTDFVGRAKAGGFDGLYTYDIGTWASSILGRVCAQAHRIGLLCAPSVGPGYDARLATDDPVVRSRLNGTTYDHMWRAAIRAHADLVTITSYNEWQEGTQIEPARPQVGRATYNGAWGKHGLAAQRAYLDATARWVARFEGSSLSQTTSQ
jgi:hypothetical protein